MWPQDTLEEQETRKELDKTDPNKAFEELLESNQIYREVYESQQKGDEK